MLRSIVGALALASALLLSACVSDEEGGPEMSVFKARSLYDTTVLNLAHQYWALPTCTDTLGQQPCQDSEIAMDIADGDRAAEAAFNAAELCVRTNPECDIEAVTAAASAAAAEVAAIMTRNGITSAWLTPGAPPS